MKMKVVLKSCVSPPFSAKWPTTTSSIRRNFKLSQRGIRVSLLLIRNLQLTNDKVFYISEDGNIAFLPRESISVWQLPVKFVFRNNEGLLIQRKENMPLTLRKYFIIAFTQALF